MRGRVELRGGIAMKGGVAMGSRVAMRLALLAIAACAGLRGQTAATLTLEEAERIALQNHPRMAAAKLTTAAAQEAVKQTQAALRPQLSGLMTGSVSEHGTLNGAGQLPPQGLFSRSAAGISVNQVAYDFGRAKTLTQAAESRVSAQNERANVVRLELKLRVRDAFYRMLQAQSQLKALKGNIEMRALTYRQVSALARSNLRSTLDVSFAELNLAEAELALTRAENEVRSSEVDLNAALGFSDSRRYTLAEPAEPTALEESADGIVARALANRPELAAAKMDIQALRRQSENERRQLFPNISLVGVGGYFGPRAKGIHPSYGAVGVNVSIPVLTGGLFTARRDEASLRAEAETQQLRDLEIRVARDVRLAWVEADNARRRLELTAKVLEQAVRTLKLAQTRYDLGLSSIVELSQAQLSRTSGEVEAAAAKYEYWRRRNFLEYQSGLLP